MGEIWERAVETAIDGQTDISSVRTLTLDGAVKCVHGRLPPPVLFEKFENLQHFSIANIGVSSLEHFPRLQNLQKLILSDNRIAGGLEFLVESGLDSLRDLDLSNNRIQDIDDLRPLAELKLVSLDLYECPVTRVKDYRSRVFGLIRSLKYLDKMDADGNERPESDDEDDDEEDEEDDPGSGEVDGDGEDRPFILSNGHSTINEGIIDVDEDDESDADEEETETLRVVNGVGESSHHQSNGFRVAAVGSEDIEEDEGEDEEDNDSVEEIDEEDGDEEDVVEVHEIEDSDDEEDGVEDEDDEDDDDDDVDEEEEVDNDGEEFIEPESTGRLISTEGEIDGHEQGEEDGDEDDNGETEEEEQGVEEDLDMEDEEDEEEEDTGTEYHVQPVGQVEEDTVGSDMEPRNEDEEEENEDEDPEEIEVEDDEDPDEEDVEDDEHPQSSSIHKRKRDEDDDDHDHDDDDDDEDDDDDDGVV